MLFLMKISFSTTSSLLTKEIFKHRSGVYTKSHSIQMLSRKMKVILEILASET